MEYFNASPMTAGADPVDIQNAYQIIEPLIQNGEQQTAMTRLLEMEEKYPASAQIQNDLGVLYYQSGDMERAFDHYQKATKLSPENVTFQKNLADFFLVEKGDIEQSLSIYTRILAHKPTDIEILQAIGQICLSLNKLEDAAVFFNRILEIEPWNQTAWKALEALSPSGPEKTTPQSSSTDNSYEQIEACLNAGKTQEAVQLLETMVRLFPENARVFNDLGVLYFQQGNKAKSLYYYQKAVQLEPGNTSFQKNLADFYLIEMEEIEEALKLYLEVLKKDPADLETLFALGHICIQMEKLEDARIFYNRILDIEPWNLNAQELLDSLNADK